VSNPTPILASLSAWAWVGVGTGALLYLCVGLFVTTLIFDGDTDPGLDAGCTFIVFALFWPLTGPLALAMSLGKRATGRRR
jgi:hypothetical protein